MATNRSSARYGNGFSITALTTVYIAVAAPMPAAKAAAARTATALSFRQDRHTCGTSMPRLCNGGWQRPKYPNGGVSSRRTCAPVRGPPAGHYGRWNRRSVDLITQSQHPFLHPVDGTLRQPFFRRLE